MNTKKIGNLTELQCATYLYELGCSISFPFGNSDKYDLIIDYKSKLYKIQCEHANEMVDEDNNVVGISVKTTWQSHNSCGWESNKYKADEVDYFATYYKGVCYLIPINESSNIKYLRLITPKNNQEKRISYLKDFEAKVILESNVTN